jgi:hypothetical protein
MSFKPTRKNKNGTFKVDVPRDLSQSQMIALCQLAINLVPQEDDAGMTEKQYFGPNLPQQDLFTHTQNQSSLTTQTKLGEFPVDSINMGTYVMPDQGVKIRMLSFTQIGRVAAFKAFHDETGISLYGSRAIVYGNFPCPILTAEVAEKIMVRLRAADVYAKIVPVEIEQAA